MKFCKGVYGKTHVYNDTIHTGCPYCIAMNDTKSYGTELNKEFLGLIDTPEQITTETFAPIEEEKKDIQPPLCIDCHYIATSFDKDFTKFRCLHPDNHQGKNLVDGSNVYLYEFCWQLRSGQVRHPQACCDRQGKGFKQRTPPPVMSVDAPASNVTSIGPRKIPKLSATDLDNL